MARTEVAGAAVDQWLAEWRERPKLRGWLHAGALVPSAALIATIAQRDVGPRRAGVLAGGAGWCAMLGASAAYHRLPRTARQAFWMRRVDHAMIFAAIAGTWTLVADAALDGRWKKAATTSAWTGAVAGGGIALLTLDERRDLAMPLYPALGVAGAAMLPAVVRHGGVVAGGQLAAGGALYGLGAVVLARREPNPVPGVFGYHEVWHAATLAAGAFHGAAIARLWRRFRNTTPDAT